MEKIMVIKENGVTEEASREKLVSNAPYLSKKENCFGKYINLDNIKSLNKNYIIEIKNIINTMVQEISKNQEVNKIDELMCRLMNVEKKEDLENIVNYIIENYYIDSISNNNSTIVTTKLISKIKADLKNNPDVVISIVVKKIISTYFYKCVSSLNREQIGELEFIKLSGVSMDYIIECFGITYNETSKENGVYKLSKNILNDIIDIVFEAKQKHLCWENCVNASPDLCPKVTDIVKKRIDEYDFITHGFQIFDEKGRMDKFIVTECENYKKTYITEKIDAARTRKLKESLMLTYYDTDNIREAIDIRNYERRKEYAKK